MNNNECEYKTKIDEEIIHQNNSVENNNAKKEFEKKEVINESIDPQISSNNNDNLFNNSIEQNATESNISENIDNNIIDNDVLNNNSINNNTNNNINMDEINNQNENNNDSINFPDFEAISEIYNPKFSFSFILFFLLNTLAYVHSYSKSFQLKNFTLCLYPVINKNQYYRLISCHFFHFGFFDYLTTMLGLYFTTKYLEREIGSIYTILIIFHGLVFSSIFYILIMWIFKALLRYSEYNFVFQCGFSSIDFCLFLSYFLLSKNYRSNLNFSFIDLRGIHSVFLVILIFQLITPSASIVLNMCGTLSAFLSFNFFKYFSLPMNYWIKDTERLLHLDKRKNCEIKTLIGYFSINENENIIKNVKQLDSFFVMPKIIKSTFSH